MYVSMKDHTTKEKKDYEGSCLSLGCLIPNPSKHREQHSIKSQPTWLLSTINLGVFNILWQQFWKNLW